MSDSLSELKRCLLKRLQNAKGHKLPGSQFRPYANDQKQLGVTEAQVQTARDELLQHAFIVEKKAGGGRSYHLTPAGITFLRTPALPPPGYDEQLLPYHKSYLLLLLLRSEGRKASLADLCARLNTKSVKEGPLCFAQRTADDRLLINRPLVGWILDALALGEAATRTESKGIPSYCLTEAGEELLGASDQYPSPQVKFTLTGEELSALMAAARLAGKGVAEPQHEKHEEEPGPLTTLTREQLLTEFERLKRERYAEHGMVPIHELRRIIADRFGPAAAEHDVFDTVLKELRRERQIRLVALGDGGIVSEQQIADSIRGENEIYFMIESAHEPASVQ